MTGSSSRNATGSNSRNATFSSEGTTASLTSRWLWLAALVGTVPAVASGYWGLWGVAALVVIGALLPAITHGLRIPGRALWRTIASLTCAGVLLYGLVTLLVSGLIHLGALTLSSAVLESAPFVPALLWGPLFVAWGLALFTGLWRTRSIA